MDEKWHSEHRSVMADFLSFLNDPNTKIDGKVVGQFFVLKGGTALLFCHGLDRFSEDLDFDAFDVEQRALIPLVIRFCAARGFGCTVKKDTETTQRVMVKYNDDDIQHPLKVECSCRQKLLIKEDVVEINGIRTYSIDRLFRQKMGAYMSRDTLRDLYDVTFILKNHFDKLAQESLGLAMDSFSVKGLDHFDIVTETQKDPLIDNDALAEHFLDAFDRLGILAVRESIDEPVVRQSNQESQQVVDESVGTVPAKAKEVLKEFYDWREKGYPERHCTKEKMQEGSPRVTKTRHR